MSRKFVVEVAKVPYKDGHTVDIRYIKTDDGNIFSTPLDVVKVLHENDDGDSVRKCLSRVIIKLGLTFGGMIESSMFKVDILYLLVLFSLANNSIMCAWYHVTHRLVHFH